MIARRKEHVWLLLPTVITLVIITVFPLIYALNVSLRDYSLAGGKQVHDFNNFKNFGYVLRDPEFYNSLWVTCKFSFLCLLIELPLGLGLAVLFYRFQDFRGDVSGGVDPAEAGPAELFEVFVAQFDGFFE